MAHGIRKYRFEEKYLENSKILLNYDMNNSSPNPSKEDFIRHWSNWSQNCLLLIVLRKLDKETQVYQVCIFSSIQWIQDDMDKIALMFLYSVYEQYEINWPDKIRFFQSFCTLLSALVIFLYVNIYFGNFGKKFNEVSFSW